MIKDKLVNIDKYFSIDSSLEKYKELEESALPSDVSYFADTEYSNLYIVKKGNASFITGWRESYETKDVNALFQCKERDFVLYLPGEPMLVKTSENSEVKRIILK